MESTSRWRRALPYVVIVALTVPVAIYGYAVDVFAVVLMMMVIGPYLLAMQYRKDTAPRR